MNFLFILCLLPFTHAFIPTSLKSHRSPQFLGISTEKSTNSDLFSSGNPNTVSESKVVSESNGDIAVDFDALTKESAENAFKSKIDINDMLDMKFYYYYLLISSIIF